MFEEGFTGELRLELSHEWVGLGGEEEGEVRK